MVIAVVIAAVAVGAVVIYALFSPQTPTAPRPEAAATPPARLGPRPSGQGEDSHAHQQPR